MAFKAPRTNQTFSRTKKSGAMAAQIEATFTTNSNPQPELSARMQGLGWTWQQAQEGPPEHQHDGGDQGIRRVGWLRILKKYFIQK